MTMRYAITGVTGKVGGTVARGLLQAGQTVRAVLRDPKKARDWAARGCEIALAEMSDGEALTRAFSDCEGVFVLLPPNFDPSPGFPEVRRILDALRSALLETRPARLVCLSTVGAQARNENLLTSLGLMELTLGELPIPTTFLRAAWFIDNCSWDVGPARESGVIHSFLQPLDRRFAMVAAHDVGDMAAVLLGETWSGRRVVELEGPSRFSPNDIASALGHALGKAVEIEAVPRASWERLFVAQGMAHPTPRMRMLDGFNEGWIDFESSADLTLKGTTSLDTVVDSLVEASRADRGAA